MGSIGAKRTRVRPRSVREDWSAWLPNEMDRLFGAARGELESSNVILSITLDEALAFCESDRFEAARESAPVFADLFDRLAIRLNLVNQTIREHGTHFGTLPNVSPLSASNFRGATAQRISMLSGLLARAVFSGRTRFFHKLSSLNDIVEQLQLETRALAKDAVKGRPGQVERAWRELEVLGYDLNTCMGETTVVLKSFFCALPQEELEPFRLRLITLVPDLLTAETEPSRPRSKK